MAASTKRISIAISPEIATQVGLAVATGEYASSGEVLREALRDWTNRRLLQHGSEPAKKAGTGWRDLLDTAGSPGHEINAERLASLAELVAYDQEIGI